jgi:NAD(P)-dependent dehydrogenase (short-subunit alcohol dehydrogenase family)
VQQLKGKVALVAGATRGAGRGIACMLGEAGATVYCSGRSVRGRPNRTGYFAGRPETIDETAEMVTAHGGIGIAVRTDHLVEEQVAALCERVRREQGRLDVLVNDISEGEAHEWKPFWKLSLDKGLRALRQGIHSHIITSRYATPLLVEGRRGLIIEITDGDSLIYRQNLFFDLVKISVNRLAFAMAEELYKHKVAALAVTPGYMRTEVILERFGVTEANWRDAGKKDPLFLASETPFFVGRAIAALAADPKVLDKSGGLYSSWGLAREYGFTDIDGSRPDLGKHFKEFPFGPPRTGFHWTLSRLPKAERGGSGKRRASARRSSVKNRRQ